VPIFVATVIGLCSLVWAFPDFALIFLLMTQPAVGIAFDIDRYLHKRRKNRNRIPRATVVQ
jgi:hypothetical protein